MDDKQPRHADSFACLGLERIKLALDAGNAYRSLGTEWLCKDAHPQLLERPTKVDNLLCE